MFDLETLKMTPFWGDEFYPPATDELIDELEQLCGHPLLPLHKEILKKYNGGGPNANRFSMVAPGHTFPVERTFAYFYPISSNRNKINNLLNLVTQYVSFIGKDTLPFAESTSEEIYYFKWVNSVPQIWYFQFQEQEPKCTFITNSFEELLNNLYLVGEL